MKNKYDDIIGWFTRNGRRIPIRRSGAKKKDAKLTGWEMDSGKPTPVNVDPELVKQLEKLDKMKKTKTYKDALACTANKGFTDTQREDVAYHIYNIKTKAEREMWMDAFRDTYYVSVPNIHPHYKPSADTVYINEQSSARTLFHETAHRLDHHMAIECEYDGVTKDVEPSTMIDLMLDHEEVYDEYVDYIGYRTNKNGDVVRANDNKGLFEQWMIQLGKDSNIGTEWRSLFSDMSSGLTHNRLGEPAYGYHGTGDYWDTMPFLSDNPDRQKDMIFGLVGIINNGDLATKLTREAWAHYCSMRAANPKALIEFRNAFPQFTRVLEEVYELLY